MSSHVARITEEHIDVVITTCRGHVNDDVTTSQPLDDVVAARQDLDVNLVRVLVGARLARPDVLHAGAAFLYTQ